jgi:hypothetical protein
MATYLNSPVVTVNSVALTGQCTAATLERSVDALESTAFGDTAHKYVGGLQSNTVTLTMYGSFAATETYATLSGLVGSTTTITLKPTSAANSPTNPLFTITGAYLETLPVLDGSYGTLMEIDVVFTGGTYTVATV